LVEVLHNFELNFGGRVVNREQIGGEEEKGEVGVVVVAG
jgi:hypothetical protein